MIELTCSPLKMMVSNRNLLSPRKRVYFQGRTVSFREGTPPKTNNLPLKNGPWLEDEMSIEMVPLLEGAC